MGLEQNSGIFVFICLTGDLNSTSTLKNLEFFHSKNQANWERSALTDSQSPSPQASRSAGPDCIPRRQALRNCSKASFPLL